MTLWCLGWLFFNQMAQKLWGIRTACLPSIKEVRSRAPIMAPKQDAPSHPTFLLNEKKEKEPEGLTGRPGLVPGFYQTAGGQLIQENHG